MISKILLLTIFFPILVLKRFIKIGHQVSSGYYDYVFIKPDNLGDIVIFINCLNKYSLIERNILVFVRKEFVEIVTILQPDITVIALPSLDKLTSVFSFFEVYKFFSKYSAKNLIVPVRSRYFFYTDFVSTMIFSERSSTLNHDGLNTKFNFAKKIEKIVYDEIIISKYKPEKFCIIEFLSKTLKIPMRKGFISVTRLKKKKSRFIVMSPFTTDTKRNLTEKMVVSILETLKDYDFRVIIVGAPSDAIHFRDVYLTFDNVEWRVGDTKLSDLPKIIENSNGLISAETGTVQLSDFFDIPTLVVLGGGHYGRFIGDAADTNTKRIVCTSDDHSCFGCNWSCTKFNVGVSKKLYPCLSSIGIKIHLKKFLRKVKHEYA